MKKISLLFASMVLMHAASANVLFKNDSTTAAYDFHLETLRGNLFDDKWNSNVWGNGTKDGLGVIDWQGTTPVQPGQYFILTQKDLSQFMMAGTNLIVDAYFTDKDHNRIGDEPVQAVPEPATPMLLFAGLGIAGIVRGQRRRA